MTLVPLDMTQGQSKFQGPSGMDQSGNASVLKNPYMFNGSQIPKEGVRSQVDLAESFDAPYFGTSAISTAPKANAQLRQSNMSTLPIAVNDGHRQSNISTLPIAANDQANHSQFPQERSTSKSRVNVQKSTLLNVPIDPAGASQYMGHKDRSAVGMHPIDPAGASQYNFRHQGNNIEYSAITTHPIDPAADSQYDTFHDGVQSQSGMQMSALPVKPIDPMGASQYQGRITNKSNRIEASAVTVQKSAMQTHPIEGAYASQYMGRMSHVGSQSSLDRSGIPTKPIDPVAASQYYGRIQESAIPIQTHPVDPAYMSVVGGQHQIQKSSMGMSQIPQDPEPRRVSNVQYQTTPEPGYSSAQRSQGTPNRVVYNQGVSGGPSRAERTSSPGTYMHASQDRSVSPDFGAGRYSSTPQPQVRASAPLPIQLPDGSLAFPQGQVGASQLGSFNPQGQVGPIVKQLQPIYLPDNAYTRNVILTNDGKQMLIPLNGGTNSMKMSAGAMANVFQGSGSSNMGSSQVRRVINDSAMRGTSPGNGKQSFMPLIFSQVPGQ